MLAIGLMRPFSKVVCGKLRTPKNRLFHISGSICHIFTMFNFNHIFLSMNHLQELVKNSLVFEKKVLIQGGCQSWPLIRATCIHFALFTIMGNR